MKRNIYITAAFLFSLLVLPSCNFLDKDPQGIMDQDKVMEQAEGLVVSAYSALGNDHYDIPFSLWPYGNVRSDDAYKGGGGTNDIGVFHFFETSQNIKANFGEADRLWFNLYQGISRTNIALQALDAISVDAMPGRDARRGEMFFIRGHFYFILKIMYGHVPFVDEKTEDKDYETTTNELPNDEQWALIVSDFEKAYELLPVSRKNDVGRADKIAAAAYLAKARLYKAYRQDERNNVVSIDDKDLEEVVKYSEIVMNSNFGLESDYAFNFLPGSYENGKESIFSVQFSHNDGTEFGRLNWSDVLSTPQKLGCCDFHKPSQNLVNAFKTNRGLPLFDKFNEKNYNAESDTSDPRLFHTVAMPGFPYKYSTKDEYVFEEE